MGFVAIEAAAVIVTLAALWWKRYHLARMAVGALFRVFKAGPAHSARRLPQGGLDS